MRTTKSGTRPRRCRFAPIVLALVAALQLAVGRGDNHRESKAVDPPGDSTESGAHNDLRSLAERWHRLAQRILVGSISKRDALDDFLAYHRSLRALVRNGRHGLDRSVFPVGGYDASHIGGTNGSGYRRVERYDFFDGNHHDGHPAHDIFVEDTNQDLADDRTGAPIPVLAMADGVVLSTKDDWVVGSDMRSGNYVYLFVAVDRCYLCYAHLDSIFVSVGSEVERGDTLGTLGRTGKNACLSRSPTHLHLMGLKVEGDRVAPFDTYRILLAAKPSGERH